MVQIPSCESNIHLASDKIAHKITVYKGNYYCHV